MIFTAAREFADFCRRTGKLPRGDRTVTGDVGYLQVLVRTNRHHQMGFILAQVHVVYFPTARGATKKTRAESNWKLWKSHTTILLVSEMPFLISVPAIQSDTKRNSLRPQTRCSLAPITFTSCVALGPWSFPPRANIGAENAHRWALTVPSVSNRRWLETLQEIVPALSPIARW